MDVDGLLVHDDDDDIAISTVEQFIFPRDAKCKICRSFIQSGTEYRAKKQGSCTLANVMHFELSCRFCGSKMVLSTENEEHPETFAFTIGLVEVGDRRTAISPVDCKLASCKAPVLAKGLKLSSGVLAQRAIEERAQKLAIAYGLDPNNRPRDKRARMLKLRTMSNRGQHG